MLRKPATRKARRISEAVHQTSSTRSSKSTPASPFMDEPVNIHAALGAPLDVAAPHNHDDTALFRVRGARPVRLQVPPVVNVEVEVAARVQGARHGSRHPRQIRLQWDMIYGIVLAGDQVGCFRQPERPHVAADHGYGRPSAASLLAGERTHRGREIHGEDPHSAAREFERGGTRATSQVAGAAHLGKNLSQNSARARRYASR